MFATLKKMFCSDYGDTIKDVEPFTVYEYKDYRFSISGSSDIVIFKGKLIGQGSSKSYGGSGFFTVSINHTAYLYETVSGSFVLVAYIGEKPTQYYTGKNIHSLLSNGMINYVHGSLIADLKKNLGMITEIVIE